MTDNEIMKALECFLGEACLGDECPYFKINNGCDDMLKDVYDLINRQKAEIERLLEERTLQEIHIENQRISEKHLMNQNIECAKRLRKVKSEAIKEFAERLKKEYADFDKLNEIIQIENLFLCIDDLVKEMTEGTK